MQEYSPAAVDAEVQKVMDQNPVPNILICGQTGVGKSSVVNYLFNDTVTVAGTGEPCTKGITFFPSQEVGIYDSEGYEIGGEKQADYEQLIFNFLSAHKEASNPEAVHLVWYAISGAGKRFTDLDIKLIQRIKSEGFPVAVLLTKIDELDEEQLGGMLTELSQELPGEEIFKLSKYAKDNDALFAICDWEELTNWSYDNLADTLKLRFVAGLRDGLAQKTAQAKTFIGLAATAAAATAASPIPFSDALLLAPIQTGLILKIAASYNISIQKSAIVSLATSVGASALGKSIAGGLLKLIPGVGTVLGGAINAAVASSLTYALGTAFAKLCENQAQALLDGEKPMIDIETAISAGSFIANVAKMAKAGKQ